MKAIMAFYQRDEHFAALEADFPQVEFVYPVSTQALAEALPGAEILAILGTRYSLEVAKLLLDQGQNLKWLQSTTTGVEVFIKLGYPAQAILTKGAGIWDVSVAEHSVAFILALLRHIPQLERNRQGRDWNRENTWNMMRSVTGRSVGIAGYGHIGQGIARRLAGWDVKINAYVRSLDTKDEKINRLYGPGQFNDFVAESDIIVLTLPCTPETEYIMDAQQFALLKPGALLINVARGKLIRESALIEALKQGQLAAAGLDVFEEEPLPATSGLWDIPNIIISPHCAATGDNDMLYTCQVLRENLQLYLAGQPLHYLYDKIKGY